MNIEPLQKNFIKVEGKADSGSGSDEQTESHPISSPIVEKKNLEEGFILQNLTSSVGGE